MVRVVNVLNSLPFSEQIFRQFNEHIGVGTRMMKEIAFVWHQIFVLPLLFKNGGLNVNVDWKCLEVSL